MDPFYDVDDDEEEFPMVRQVQCGVHSIRTTVTASAAEVSRWIDQQLVRFRPPHMPERRNAHITVGMAVQQVRWCVPAAATLQLCIDEHCLIFQLIHADGCPENMRRFLVDENVLLVGVRNHLQRELLRCSRLRLEANRPLDLRFVAAQQMGRGMSIMPTVELAGRIVRERGVLDNRLVASGNWDWVQMGSLQVEFLCHRAFLSYSIATVLLTPVHHHTGYVIRLTAPPR